MKKLLAVILTLAVLVSASSAVLAAEANDKTEETKLAFTDVTKDTPGAEAIYKLVEAGIVSGHGDGTFKPNDHLTRAELTKMINLTFGYTEKATENFKDVKTTDWYYDHLLIAKKAGYIVGFDDGRFGGEEPLTREQVCMVISRCVELMPLDLGIKITDEVSDWAKDAVNKVVSNMLMPLEADNTFRATKNITRVELAQSVVSFVSAKTTEQYTLTFEVNGGKKLDAVKVDKDKVVSLGEYKTTKDGYTFGGWYSDSTLKTKVTQVAMTKDTTIYAKWTKESAGGGGGGGGNSGGGGGNDDYFADLNEAVVDNLNSAVDQIWNSGIQWGKYATVLQPVRQGINKALAVKNETELTSDYIESLCETEIQTVQTRYDALTEDEQDELKNKLAEALDTSTTAFLYNTFLKDKDIDID